MQKWKYRIVTGWQTSLDLDEYGAKGWELIQVIPPHAKQDKFKYIFKKPH